ncbi:MAG: hypothetical protein WBA12_15350 [Catalinimonas sp.]
MKFTVELKKEYALRVLEDLQMLDAIALTPLDTPEPQREKTFEAVRVNTKGFRFNREDAHGRR